MSLHRRRRNPEGTSVRVRLTLVWSLWAFFGVLWYPGIVVGLILGSESSNGIPATTANPLVTLLVLLSLIVGPWLMYVPSFWSAARAYRAELERLLAYQ